MNVITTSKTNLLQQALLKSRLYEPYAYLGLHTESDQAVVRVFRPYDTNVWIRTTAGFEPMELVHSDGIFEWRGESPPSMPYQLRIEKKGLQHIFHEIYDPYAFPLQTSTHDLHLFREGKLWQAYLMLGAQPVENSGVKGSRFSVWAPNAERVSIVGDFNCWDGRTHPMSAHADSGVWELFIPGLPPNSLYKFEILSRDSGKVLIKSDPYGKHFELRPNTASLTSSNSAYDWCDAKWMENRINWDWLHAPLNILEIHASSWKRHSDGRVYTYRELAQHLLPYVLSMGYTHIEFMPISEHPLDESWGYQTTGYFAVTSRYGSSDDFKFFVDACHQAGIGVILDWVPAHFPQDSFALARFDGTALYEHEDPRQGFHQDWGTFIFNYGRNEVKSFLLSSAYYWLSEFHLDGLRVDAVASMLYLDYSRREGEWLPNKYGGRENLEAVDFIRDLNVMVHGEFPGALTLAEESTAWSGVSRPAYVGGLGFSIKWNMGWMNDTLSYMRQDPIFRRYHHQLLTFSHIYAYTENFVLPFSHDEVVHGKGSLFNKMPGDAWQKFASIRLLFTYQMTWPGKKLNFMGNEFAQDREWRVNHELDWSLLNQEQNAGVQAALRDLNHFYKTIAALHQLDFFAEGFDWIDCEDIDQSVITYMRRAKDDTFVIVILNFTPVLRDGYRIGVPVNGIYHEIFNSDSAFYGGSNIGNSGYVVSIQESWMGFSDSILITLPPLGGIILTSQGLG